MDDNKNKLEFFSDIKDKLLLIAGGLLSMATIVPLFINSIQDIFHFSVQVSFYVFVFLYFFAPLMLYIMYCSIYDYVGYLQLLPDGSSWALDDKKWHRRIIEGLTLLVVFAFLIFSNIILNLLVVCLAVCLLFFIYTYIRKSANGSGIFTEFNIIGGVIAVLFVAFYVSNATTVGRVLFTAPADAPCEAFKYFGYNKLLDNMAGRTADFKNECYKDFSYAFSSGNIVPDTDTGKYQSGLEAAYHMSGLLQQVDNSITAVGSFNEQNRPKDLAGRETDPIYFAKLYQVSSSLNDYANVIREQGQDQIKEKWLVLIKQAQFKGLIWLFLLILLSLCLWLKMNNRLTSINTIKLPLGALAGEKEMVIDNVSQVKSLIYILLLLVLPFFRQIEKKDIDLSKPYLSFNISNVIQGSFHTDTDEKGAAGKNEKDGKPSSDPGTVAGIELLKLKMDSLKQRIDMLAAHTIQNGDEYDQYKGLDKNTATK